MKEYKTRLIFMISLFTISPILLAATQLHIALGYCLYSIVTLIIVRLARVKWEEDNTRLIRIIIVGNFGVTIFLEWINHHISGESGIFSILNIAANILPVLIYAFIAVQLIKPRTREE